MYRQWIPCGTAVLAWPQPRELVGAGSLYDIVTGDARVTGVKAPPAYPNGGRKI